MKEWTRAQRARGCGRCGLQVKPGDPVLLIQVASGRKLVRCQSCAGEPVPEGLPVLLLHSEPVLQSHEHRGGFSRLPRDFKLAQSGDGE